MSGFAIRNPYFVVVACLMVAIVGATASSACPWTSSRRSTIPVVVVATFYSGMPPEQIETDITGRFERFFTLGSGIDHIESRSLPGVSLIKIYFQPGAERRRRRQPTSPISRWRICAGCRPARCRPWC